MNKHNPTNQQPLAPFDIFIVSVSLLSIINIPLYLLIADETLSYVISSVDILLSLFFFGDFVRRYRKSTNKLHYMAREYGWADLFSSIPMPQFSVLRIMRLLKVYAIIRRTGAIRLLTEIKNNLASSALYVVTFMIIVLLEFGSVAILYVESASAESNIVTASDALWWVYVTITTVGYGDTYPVTNPGRLIGALVLLTGVGLFGVVTGFLANKFMPRETVVNISSDDN